MDNLHVAAIFQDIADLLEIKGENKFKIRAYQRVVRTIESLPQELDFMAASGADLKTIPGVGDAIAKKIEEILKSGKLHYYEELKSEFPPGITALLEIPGVGPKTAKKLSDEGINTVDELEVAIKDGKVASIFRLGEKTAENILHQIQNLRRKDMRIPIGEALPVVDEVFTVLGKVRGVRNLVPAGSLRRFRDTVGDIDLMGTADNPEAVIKAFTELPVVSQVLAFGPTKASVVLRNGLQADLRIVEHDSFGSLLQYFTGSKQHNILLRTRYQKQGLSLSEYGITDEATGKLEKYATEEAFYARLGLQYIPPEIREGQGEIELAEEQKVPQLVELGAIRGDLHVHTTWSDGKDTIEDMAAAAAASGYSYIAITDHSAGLGIAHGLNTERLSKQLDEISRVNTKLKGIRIFTGIEVDIRADGSLDLPQEVLKGLDIVIAAVHSAMNQNQEQVTQRILKTLENPDVDILAHPTCRLIGVREPVAVDMEAVFKAALKYHKALEINAMPNRLDLKDMHIQRARDMGIRLALGTDAHSASQLGFMRFGVGTARRGWCRTEDLLNTRKTEDVLKFFRR